MKMDKDMRLAAVQGIGTVYGVVLNDRASLEKLGSALADAPYKGAPKAPVMYLKPANTLLASGSTVILPAGAQQVEVGATLGIVIGQAASRLAPAHAAAVIAGYVLVADLSLPHASYYRPAIREKCFDGACPIGVLISAAAVGAVEQLKLATYIDDQLVQERALADLVCDVPHLLADVTEFMTLNSGDILLVGVSYLAPQAAAGSRVRVVADRLGSIEFTIAAGQGGGNQ